MARIRLAYLGGGSTRAAGTMASFIHHRGADFDGSEVVLIDLAGGDALEDDFTVGVSDNRTIDAVGDAPRKRSREH